MRRRALVLALSILTWSQLGFSADLTAQVTADFAGATAEQLSISAKILQRRFSEFRGSNAARADVSLSQSKVTVSVTRVKLSDANAKLLASVQGTLQVLVNGRAVVTDVDIEKVNVVSAGSGAFFNLLLSKSAGTTLAAATRSSVGQSMSIVWEGRTILTAPVRGEVGRELNFSAPEAEEAMLMLVVLRCGRLPKPPLSVELRHGA